MHSLGQPKKAYIHSYRFPSDQQNIIHILPRPLRAAENEWPNNQPLTSVLLQLPVQNPKIKKGETARVDLAYKPCISFFHDYSEGVTVALSSHVLMFAATMKKETYDIAPSEFSTIGATYMISECNGTAEAITHNFLLDSPLPLITAHYTAGSASLIPPEVIQAAEMVVNVSDLSRENKQEYLSQTLLSKFLLELGSPSPAGLKRAIEAALRKLGLYDEKTTLRGLNALLRNAPEACDGKFRHFRLKPATSIPTIICLPAFDLIGEQQKTTGGTS